MEVLFLLVPLAVLMVALIVAVFCWASMSGQFDDLEGPAYRMLMDDDSQPPTRTAEPGEDDGGDT